MLLKHALCCDSLHRNLPWLVSPALSRLVSSPLLNFPRVSLSWTSQANLIWCFVYFFFYYFYFFSLAQKKTEPNAISHFVANIHILELCTVFFASSIIHLTFVFNFDFIDWSNMMRLTSFFHCRLKNTHRSHYITLSHIVAPFAWKVASSCSRLWGVVVFDEPVLEVLTTFELLSGTGRAT